MFFTYLDTLIVAYALATGDPTLALPSIARQINASAHGTRYTPSLALQQLAYLRCALRVWRAR